MLRLQKILLPVDFSARSNVVIPYVKAFASQFRSQFLIVHVEHGPLYTTQTGFLGVQAGRVEHIDWVRDHLQSFLADELDGLVIRRDLIEGDPAKRIMEYARAHEVDLIMMPTHGYGPYRRFFVGSVTAEVLHDSEVPLWTEAHIEENQTNGQVSYKKIACALDLGPHSQQVLSAAAEASSLLGAELLVIHVTHTSKHHPAHAEAAPTTVEEARDVLAGLLKNVEAKADIAVESGSVIEDTCKRAKQFCADLLVVGRHAAKGLAGALHPHTYAFIRESRCPVLSI